MRRISAKYATTGMVLGRDVFDSHGSLVLTQGVELNQETLDKLETCSTREVLIEDDRSIDVLVSATFPPEVEGQTVRVLRELITDARSTRRIDEALVHQLGRQLGAMIRCPFPEPLGDINATGRSFAEEYP